MSLSAGQMLSHYRLVEKIGEGGMGVVWSAFDTTLDRKVAIKILPTDVADDPKRRSRFEREAKMVARLSHPNLLGIHEFGTEKGIAFTVTELLGGETLRDRLRDGALGWRKAIEIGAAVAEGLAAAHARGVVHRDLKPSNIFLTNDGRVKILDFGLAQPSEPVPAGDDTQTLPPTDTEPGTILGTIHYMSPEQVRGQAVDHRSDIFSLGAILYEMVVGRPTFEAATGADTITAILTRDQQSLLEIRPDLPVALDHLVRRCLAKNPDQRFQSALDVAFDLQTMTSVSVPRRISRAQLSASRWMVRVGIVAGAAVSLGVALLLGYLAGNRSAGTERTTFRQLSFERGMVFSARFTPGEESLVYSAATEGIASRLYFKRLDSPESIALDLPESYVASVSPTGEMGLLLASSEMAGRFPLIGRLATAPLTGGAPRAVAESVWSADFAPDGSGLAVARLANGLTRVEYPLGKVLLETKSWISHLEVSPSGDRLAFCEHVQEHDTYGSVAVLGIDGKKTTLTGEFNSAWGLAWHPSGREIWFTATDDPTAHSVYAVDLSGRLRVIDRLPGIPQLMDISTDGRVLLAQNYVREEISGLASGETTERDLSWLGQSFPTDLSSDGGMLLFLEQSVEPGSLYEIGLRRTDGSPVTRLGSGVPFGLSPDGEWVVSGVPGASSRLTLLPTGPGETWEVEIGLSVNWATWLPDGDRLVVAGAAGDEAVRLHLVDLERGSVVRPISPEGIEAHIMIRPVASPDGQWLATVGSDQRIWLYSVNGAEPRPVAGAVAEEIPVVWTRDGKGLFVAQLKEIPARVFRVDLETGERQPWKELGPSDRAGTWVIHSLVMTPDGTAYAYSYYRSLSVLYMVSGWS